MQAAAWDPPPGWRKLLPPPSGPPAEARSAGTQQPLEHASRSLGPPPGWRKLLPPPSGPLLGQGAQAHNGGWSMQAAAWTPCPSPSSCWRPLLAPVQRQGAQAHGGNPTQLSPGSRRQALGSLVLSSSRESCLLAVSSLICRSPGQSQGPGRQRHAQAHPAAVCLLLCQKTSFPLSKNAWSAWMPGAASRWHPVATSPIASSAQSSCADQMALKHLPGDKSAHSAFQKCMQLSPRHSTEC